MSALCRFGARRPESLHCSGTAGSAGDRTQQGLSRAYHVLHGALSPLDGIGPDDLKIPQLLDRLEQEPVEEIILATNFTIEGEATALYLAQICKKRGLRVTRLAHGIPTGSDLEYIDAGTVQQAVDGRREL